MDDVRKHSKSSEKLEKESKETDEKPEQPVFTLPAESSFSIMSHRPWKQVLTISRNKIVFKKHVVLGWAQWYVTDLKFLGDRYSFKLGYKVGKG